MSNKRAGIMSAYLNGKELEIPGDAEVTYNLGVPKRTALKGLNGKGQGYTEEPQVASAEFPIRDKDDLDTKELLQTRDGTLVLNLANGKTQVYREVVHAGDGNGTSGNGQIATRWESSHEADEF